MNRLAGTYTALLAAGTVVVAGQVLYRVDNATGRAHERRRAGLAPLHAGHDRRTGRPEFEANLIALGDAHGLLTAAGPHFGPSTVGRGRCAGRPPRGTRRPAPSISARVVFVPDRRACRHRRVSLRANPPHRATRPTRSRPTARAVAVPLTPNDPPVAVGQPVSISPALGRVDAGAGHGDRVGAGVRLVGLRLELVLGNFLELVELVHGAHGHTRMPPRAARATAIAVQVSLRCRACTDVLAVPIAALLALAGGGYGLEVVEPSGHHRLVGVSTGVFAGGDVQVSGSGLVPGTAVVVAQ